MCTGIPAITVSMISIRWDTTAKREAKTRTATSPTGRSLPPAGFTLIELIVVLAILSLMAVLATPLLNRVSPGLELKSTAHNIAAAMREARTLAIRDNGEVAVLIDLNNRLVRVGESRNAAAIDSR